MGDSARMLIEQREEAQRSHNYLKIAEIEKQLRIMKERLQQVQPTFSTPQTFSYKLDNCKPEVEKFNSEEWFELTEDMIMKPPISL